MDFNEIQFCDDHGHCICGNDCMAPDIRQRLDVAGTNRRLAVGRLRNTTEALRLLVREAVEGGLSQAEVARLTGVPRKTVREWLGLT